MNLESCFDFLGDDDIRICGTRIGIETVLDDFLGGSSPEEIAVRYRSLSLMQVYATIAYYYLNRDRVDAYLEAVERADAAAGRQQLERPSDLVTRLRNERREATAAAKG